MRQDHVGTLHCAKEGSEGVVNPDAGAERTQREQVVFVSFCTRIGVDHTITTLFNTMRG
jgi:hypothetical protein